MQKWESLRYISIAINIHSQILISFTGSPRSKMFRSTSILRKFNKMCHAPFLRYNWKITIKCSNFCKHIYIWDQFRFWCHYCDIVMATQNVKRAIKISFCQMIYFWYPPIGWDAFKHRLKLQFHNKSVWIVIGEYMGFVSASLRSTSYKACHDIFTEQWYSFT